MTGEWQPINDDAHSGIYVLLWIDHCAQIGFWNKTTRCWDDGDFNSNMGTATHWMPLPSPPAEGR